MKSWRSGMLQHKEVFKETFIGIWLNISLFVTPQNCFEHFHTVYSGRMWQMKLFKKVSILCLNFKVYTYNTILKVGAYLEQFTTKSDHFQIYFIGFSAATIVIDWLDWPLIDRVTDRCHEGKVQYRQELQKETNTNGASFTNIFLFVWTNIECLYCQMY